MANITFKFRKPKATSPQFIYIVVRFGRNEKIIYNTGLKVAPKYWNFDKMRVRAMVEVPRRELINNRLNEFAAAISKREAELVSGGECLSKDNLREFLEVYTGKREASTGSKFHDFIREYIRRNADRTNPKTGQVISYKTQREHIRVYELLKLYEQEQKGGRLLDFEHITIDFYTDFQAFLQRAGMAKNTIAHKVQTLKAWLNEATIKGENTNLQYKSVYFKAATEAADTIYLSVDELETLANTTFECERLTRVRDLFLVGAFTGLRFSDFTKITAANVRGGFINIRQQKTGGEVSIPFHPIVREIWERYGNKFPQQISNQKFNAYIKEVCKAAGLDEKIQHSRTQGGERVSKITPKYSLISSHTARRSFATNLYLEGFPALSIMQITGHKTEAQFMKYIRASAEQHGRKLRAFWAEKGEYVKQVE